MSKILTTNAAEIARAIRNHAYERDDANGRLYLKGSSGLWVGGALKIRDYRDGSIEIVNNLVVNEGLNYLLNVALPPTGGYTQIASWYIAPYSGNYTPTGALTAANFTATATEFTAYTAGTRLALPIASATTTQSTGNVGDEAELTLSAGGPYNLYGAAVISASAKSATTGTLLAAVRFGTPRLGMLAGDKLGLEYQISAGDDGV